MRYFTEKLFKKMLAILPIVFIIQCSTDNFDLIFQDKEIFNISDGLMSIAVIPGDTIILEGDTEYYSAIGTYEDLSTLDITDFVTWDSSNPGFATISNAADYEGVTNGIVEGTTIITATMGAVSGSTDLAVVHIPAMPLVHYWGGRTLTMNNLYLNASATTVVHASPGENITVRAVGNVVDSNTSCPDCWTQFYIRLNGVFNLCLGNNTDNWSFDETGSFTAPSTPGKYFLNLYWSWLYGCETSTNVSPGIQPSTVAILIVE